MGIQTFGHKMRGYHREALNLDNCRDRNGSEYDRDVVPVPLDVPRVRDGNTTSGFRGRGRWVEMRLQDTMDECSECHGDR